MLRMSEPHGGVLVDRFVTQEEARDIRETAVRLPKLVLDRRELSDLELIATGAASPLTGFLGFRDYRSVLDHLRLANGTPWPVPFTVAVELERIAALLREGAAALLDGERRLRAIIRIGDVFVRSAREEAVAMYGTDDPARPGVRYLLSRPSALVGGSVSVLRAPKADERAAAPGDIRALARRGRWSGLTGLATAEGLGCVEGTREPDGVLLGTPPVALRHAAGRDALLQAIVLKNCGAREVLLEYEHGDWLDAVARLQGEDLGVTPLLIGAGRLRSLEPSGTGSLRIHAQIRAREAPDAVAPVPGASGHPTTTGSRRASDRIDATWNSRS